VTRRDNQTTAAGPGDFLLDDWIVRPSQNRLEREAEIVHLEPEVMDLLVFEPGDIDRPPTGPTWNKAVFWQAPRTIRLGVRLSF